MEYKSFTVRLRDCTKTDDIWDYYRESKPQMQVNDIPLLDDILKMGLPINGLKYYVLEFRSSLLFRDLILSNRDIMGAWAVSNRVAKINADSTPLSEEAKLFLDDNDRISLEQKLEDIYDRIKSGEPQEYVKGDLPMMSYTRFTIGIDLRTLINFLYTLESTCPKYFELVGRKIIEECDLKELYHNHPKRNKYTELSLSTNDRTSSSMGYMHQIYRDKVSMNLLAQVVRKNIIVKSEVWNMLRDNPKKLFNYQAKDTVAMTIYLTEDNIRSLQATRTCWFAQMDKASNQSWDYILSDIVKDKSPSKFLSELPCHGCGKYCVLVGDMMARVDRVDSHFFPCPLLLNDPSIIDERINKYDSDSVIMGKWKESQDLIQFDPNNEFYRRYRK